MSEQASDHATDKAAGHAGSPQVNELADQAEERDNAVRDSEHLRPPLALVLTEMIERCDSIMGALKDLGREAWHQGHWTAQNQTSVQDAP